MPAKQSLRLTVFLLLWLGLEVAGFFMLTPFPAVRRVLGVIVVVTLLMGRLVAMTSATPSRRRTIQVILASGVVLGFAYFALDLWGARAQQQAAEQAADWIGAHGGGRVWYTGHWGFQYYAEHRGMKPGIKRYVPGDPTIDWPKSERLLANDWLVVPDEPHNQQSVHLDPLKLKQEHIVDVEDWLPLRTVPNYYGGTAALEHHSGPRMRVRIYRVVEGFDP